MAMTQTAPKLSTVIGATLPWKHLAELVNGLELGNNALLCLTAEKRIALCNPSALRLFSRDQVSLRNALLTSLIVENEKNLLTHTFEQIRKGPFPASKSFPKAALSARKPNGILLPLEGSLSTLVLGSSHGYSLLLRDITEQIRSEERMHYLATHDTLTGLPNRLAMADRLEAAIRRHRRNAARFALLFIDLDDFKPINDQFGHSIGDAVLKACASRLQKASRESDSVARLGGDEFVIILEYLKSEEELEIISRRIKTLLSGTPIRVGPHRIYIEASLGSAQFPSDGQSAMELLGQADSDMYVQKREHHRNLANHRLS